jgi:hypothetical protein
VSIVRVPVCVAVIAQRGLTSSGILADPPWVR